MGGLEYERDENLWVDEYSFNILSFHGVPTK